MGDYMNKHHLYTLEECTKQFPIRHYITFLAQGTFRLFDARCKEWYDYIIKVGERARIIGYENHLNNWVPVVEFQDYTRTKVPYIWEHLELIIVGGK